MSSLVLPHLVSRQKRDTKLVVLLIDRPADPTVQSRPISAARKMPSREVRIQALQIHG
jgi:hypothetical protein